MPRTARAAVGGYCYHVINRGNGRAEVFHKEENFAAFARLLRAGVARTDVRLIGYCLMPNHFHLVLWPIKDGDLGQYMQWLLTTHVRRYHKHYHSSSHVLTVLRYVERNRLRPGAAAGKLGGARQRAGERSGA